MKKRLKKVDNKLLPDDHITKEQFWLEWFGPFGRDLGNPAQRFSNNPNDLLDLIVSAREEKKPAFSSVQPRIKHDFILGIEKIFWDFDYGKKSEKLTEKQIEKRRTELEIEVRHFIRHLQKFRFIPFIVKTRKGYHVYVFLDSIYEIDMEDFDFWKMVYERLQRKYLNKDYKYCDSSIIGDLRRMSRVPFSIHEVSGDVCEILDVNLKPTKIRSLEYYKTYGIRREELKQEAEVTLKILKTKMEEREKSEKERHDVKRADWEYKHGFVGKIRPCFEKRMQAKEMSHQQRLALLIEAFYSGVQKEDDLVNLFTCFNDFNEKITRYQVQWYLAHRNGAKPYKCDTIIEKGWCLMDECPIYRYRKKGPA